MKDGRRKLWISVAILALLVAVAWGWQLVRVMGYEAPVKNPYALSDWHPQAAARDWKWIVIHHSASDAGDAATFDQWHRKRGWDELGYHFVINNGESQPDGLVEVGGRWLEQKQGAHAKSADGQYNDRGIGICLVGNFEKHRPTDAQWQSLLKLVSYLQKQYGIDTANVIGHRNVNPKTACPGQQLDMDELRRRLSMSE